MREIVIASNNKHKIVEIKAILGDYFDKIYSLNDLGLDIQVEETSDSFAGNAELKARAVCKATGMYALADDSGLEVAALGGLPGVRSARYAGEYATDKQNNKKLLHALDGVTERNARFVSVVVLVSPDGASYAAAGYAEGTILTVARGEGGFGYDPFFLSNDLNKTFAEATAEEKNAVSHRKRALESLRNKLIDRNVLH